MEKLIDLAYKGHTHQVYDRALVVFNKHLDLYQKELEDIMEMDMIEFLAFLSQINAQLIEMKRTHTSLEKFFVQQLRERGLTFSQ